MRVVIIQIRFLCSGPLPPIFCHWGKFINTHMSVIYSVEACFWMKDFIQSDQCSFVFLLLNESHQVKCICDSQYRINRFVTHKFRINSKISHFQCHLLSLCVILIFNFIYEYDFRIQMSAGWHIKINIVTYTITSEKHFGKIVLFTVVSVTTVSHSL